MDPVFSGISQVQADLLMRAYFRVRQLPELQRHAQLHHFTDDGLYYYAGGQSTDLRCIPLKALDFWVPEVLWDMCVHRLN